MDFQFNMEVIVRVVKETSMSKVILISDKPKHHVIWKETKDSRVRKREIEALKILKNHSDVVRFRKIKTLDHTKYIELEYIDGKNLEDILLEKKYLDEETARSFFSRLSVAFLKIHQKNVYHRDIKPSNIIIQSTESPQFKFKIIDFGVACFGPEDSTFTKKLGTQDHVAPEMIAGLPYQASKVDVYGLGLVLFEMVFGKLPFSFDERLKAITTEEKQPPIHFPAHRPVSLELRSLIIGMLDPTQGNRLSMEQVVSHPWLNIPNAKELVLRKKKLFDSFKSSKCSDFC